MKKLLFVFTLIVLALENHSQKITIEKDTVRVDGKAYCILKKVGVEPGVDNFMIQSLEGKDLILIKKDEYTDPNKLNSKGKPVTTWFYVWSFVGKDKFFDTSYFARDKKIAAIIYEGLVIKDGELDMAAVDRLILINGTSYTDKKRALLGQPVIIIKD